MPDHMTAPKIKSLKSKGQRVVCVTAYDANTAEIADAAGVDLILVGDSMGNVLLGYPDTLRVTLEQMVHHTEAVSRGVRQALLVADLPFGTYQISTEEAVRSSIALVKAGAQAVKLEGDYTEAIQAIIRAGIPVMGHIGMTPQSVNEFGGFRVQGRGAAGSILVDEARQLEDAGVFSMVLELIPRDLAGEITGAVSVPTIGIGAGPLCDGQIQVFHDVLGLGTANLKHVKRYAQGRTTFVRALKRYAKDVREQAFPSGEHSF